MTTIDTHTAITTTARRIARQVNAGTPGFKYYFDRDGVLLDSHEADRWYTERQDYADRVAVVGVRDSRHFERLTYRDVQDLLDADAYAAQHPKTYEAKSFYLHQLDVAREVEATKALVR